MIYAYASPMFLYLLQFPAKFSIYSIFVVLKMWYIDIGIAI
ncbi:hypothetical protein B4144_3551 [Bacillus atrophaeus]|nr:hypothetical protein B4144_3551 [Bacillus atrophaeus]